MTNANRIARKMGGGTAVSAPLVEWNSRQEKSDLVILISDQESWVDTSPHTGQYQTTALVNQWDLFRRRNPRAKLVCIDLAPYTTTQAPTVPDTILNVGGFSDAVFDVIRSFLRPEGVSEWVAEIEAVEV